MELEDAVTVHPNKYFWALAMSWGLQQTALKHLKELLYWEGCLGKCKANIDNRLRQVRVQEGQDNNSVTESELASS